MATLKAVLEKHQYKYWTFNTSREKNRSLHTTDCSLHQNEHPFKTLFSYVSSTIGSPTTITGPLCKLWVNDFYDLPQITFTAVGSPLDTWPDPWPETAWYKLKGFLEEMWTLHLLDKKLGFKSGKMVDFGH